MNCRLCQGKTNKIGKYKILNRYEVDYYCCEKCELIQTERPYWLEEAYSDAISILDTGLMRRNLCNCDRVSVLIYELSMSGQLNMDFNRDQFLDFGGGHGVFTRLMRDVGYDFYWHDKYAKNLFARGFEGLKKKYKIVTCFELFEHFENPLEEIKSVIEFSQPDMIIFSTWLYGRKIPDPDWWYYTFESGQHICFYNKKTLQYLADALGMQVVSLDDSFHILSREKLKISLKIKFYEKFVSKIKNKINSKTIEDHQYTKKILQKLEK